MEERKAWQELLILAVILILFVFAFMNVSKLKNKFAKAPTLTSNISEMSSVSEENITITGKTDSGVTLTINNKEIEEDKDGNFSTVMSLTVGENKMNITAKNKANKTTTLEKTIIRIVSQVNTNTEVIEEMPGSSVVSQVSGDLASSGPTENMGIVGLSLIFLSLFVYFKSLKHKQFTNSL